MTKRPQGLDSTGSQSIAVVGLGELGRTIASTLLLADQWRRVVLYSSTAATVEGCLADLEDLRENLGLTSLPQAATSLAELAQCSAIVVALRAPFKNLQEPDVRSGGLVANGQALIELSQELGDYCGTVLVVTNPVDTLTYLLDTLLPSATVFGIGSQLDSARLRTILSQELAVEVEAVTASVIGQHGDGMVACLSSASVGDEPLLMTTGLRTIVGARLRSRSPQICAGVGRTRFGPSGSVLNALRHTTGLQDGLIEVCTNVVGVHHGIPVRFSSGTATTLAPTLDAVETEQLDQTRKHLLRLQSEASRIIEGS